MSTSFKERALRIAFRLPGYRALVQRVLLGRSEISVAEARFLGELVQRAPADRPIIEIGTLFGSSTRILALFKAAETPLITVDSFRWNPYGLTREQHARITRHALRELMQRDNVELVERDKQIFYAAYKGAPPGLVFLDAHHSYESTLADIRWAQSVGAALICGHDYRPAFPGVMRAVAESGGAAEVRDSMFVLKPG